MANSEPFRFNVFLSYNDDDEPLVESLADRLQREGIEPWIKIGNLIPGEARVDGFARGLAESETCAAFVGPGGLGSWQEEDLRAAIDRRSRTDSGTFRVIPVLLPGVEQPERAKLPDFLMRAEWVEFRGSIDDPEPFHRLVCGIRGIEPGIDRKSDSYAGVCPYRGLEYFDFNDRDPRFFCGREAQINDLLKMLRDTLPTDLSGGALRFLAVLGASGSGKSSLARAGLLPALKVGKLDGSERWPIAIARPGREPLTALATALEGLDGAAVLGTYDRVAGKADGERSLHVAARRILGEPPRADRLLILVDQFEEVFTLCEDEGERRDFIANLMHAAKAPDGPAAVVLTMRADFLPKCAPYSSLAAAVTARQYLVEPMQRDDLRRAIERPARLVGLEPEAGLADLLLDDAEKNPGSLPLLQFVLKELWTRRRGSKLTIEAYRDLGGMEKAVARRADAVLAELEKHGRGEIAKRVFLSLVKLGEGTEDTRRRARLADLVPAGGDEDALQEVLRALTDPEARLVTTSGDGTVEVAHEALIRSWPMLRNWIDADREGERIKQRLDEAAAEWEKNGRPPGYLDRGPRLALARKWADEHRRRLTASEEAFLRSSEQFEQAEHRKLERNRLLIGSLLAFLLPVASLGALAWKQSREARRQESVARFATTDLLGMYGNPCKLVGRIATSETPDAALAVLGELLRSTSVTDEPIRSQLISLEKKLSDLKDDPSGLAADAGGPSYRFQSEAVLSELLQLTRYYSDAWSRRRKSLEESNPELADEVVRLQYTILLRPVLDGGSAAIRDFNVKLGYSGSKETIKKFWDLYYGGSYLIESLAPSPRTQALGGTLESSMYKVGMDVEDWRTEGRVPEDFPVHLKQVEETLRELRRGLEAGLTSVEPVAKDS